MSLPVWHIIMLKCYLDCSKISKTFKCIIEIHQNNYVTPQPVYERMRGVDSMNDLDHKCNIEIKIIQGVS